jgi:hypothetical protein
MDLKEKAKCLETQQANLEDECIKLELKEMEHQQASSAHNSTPTI